ncbi:DNA-binding HxlR family transcriptional regulator [Aeromicrobium panaciterrae]|uniref:DNA-binding HxlR family transcriptional regulator n=1 Tax=Aeromicrobium panaciterrae TaxID=363861 RepID=A0ABU1UR53_9ACTN|nr:helix-turn-helix domain-containing protein [Aeromicrobium panaciterrae]MDR7087637.1 DNA-binding HxlR family transcriptional regulator [Aeromicrobium panaciterrae]
MKVSERKRIDIPGLADGVFPAQCPSRTLLDHVTSKWGVLVLLALGIDTMRWSELRRCIEGISEKMLAQTLKTLEADGLVRRVAQPVVPPHVEYNLTAEGRELHDRLRPLMEWVAANADRIIEG